MSEVEIPRGFVDGVAEQGFYPHILRGSQASEQRILQQTRFNALPCVILMHGQSPQQGYGDGVGHVSAELACNDGMLDRASRKGVVADHIHSAARTDNEATGRTLLLIMTRPFDEPLRQRRLTAPEVIESMLLRQALRCGDGQWSAIPRRALVQQLDDSVAHRLIKEALEGCQLCAVELELRAVRQYFVRLFADGIEDELCPVLPQHIRSAVDENPLLGGNPEVDGTLMILGERVHGLGRLEAVCTL